MWSVSQWPYTALFLEVDFIGIWKDQERYQNKKSVQIVSLDKIAPAVFEVEAWPDQDLFESVASGLASKYPCLGELGRVPWTWNLYEIQTGPSYVKHRLQVNSKRSQEDDGAGSSLERAKQGEINNVCDHLNNHSDSLEEERLALVEAFADNKNVALIKQKLVLTFSLKRKVIVRGYGVRGSGVMACMFVMRCVSS